MARKRSPRGTVRNLPVRFGPVSLNANFHTLYADLYVKIDTVVHCYFKRAVDSEWRRGPDPAPVTKVLQRYCVAIIDGANGAIVPDTLYDIKLITNPGKGSAVEWTGQVSTRPEPTVPTTTRIVDVANGTELTAAMSAIQDGDHIRLTGSLYDMTNGLPEKAPVVVGKDSILVEGTGVAPAIIDGANYGPFTWVSDGGGVYRTTGIQVKTPRGQMALSVDGNFVTAVGAREQLDTVAGAAFYDNGISTLYLKLPDNTDPTGHVVGAGKSQTLMWFQNCDNVMVRNIRFRGASWSDDATPRMLVLENCRDCTVTGCHINWGGVGIQQFGDSKRITVENNRFEAGNEYMSYVRMKALSGAKPIETFSALVQQTLEDEAENIVWRRNEFVGVPNPIVLQIINNVDRIQQCHDIYENVIIGKSDDGIELDGTVINVSVFRNKCQQAIPFISCAPFFKGPVWIYDNLAVHAQHRQAFELTPHTVDFMKLTSTLTQIDTIGTIRIIKNTWKADGEAAANGHYLCRLQPDLEFGDLLVAENLLDAPHGARFGWFGSPPSNRTVAQIGRVKYRRNSFWRGDGSPNYFKLGDVNMTYADFIAAGGDDQGSVLAASEVDEVYAPTPSTPNPGGGALPGFVAASLGSTLTWESIPLWSDSDAICAAVSASPVEFDVWISGSTAKTWNRIFRLRQAKTAGCQWGFKENNVSLDLVWGRVPGSTTPSYVRLTVVPGGGGGPHQIFLEISIDGTLHNFDQTSYVPGDWQNVLLTQTAPVGANIFSSSTVRVSSVS